jgi:hypothetical protein
MGAVHVVLAPVRLLALYQAAFAGAQHARYFAGAHLAPYPQTHKLQRPGKEKAAGAAAAALAAEQARPGRFGTETDRAGNPRLGMTEVRLWDEFAGESERLLGKYEGLYEELLQEHRRRSRDVEGFKGMYDEKVPAGGPSENGEMGPRTEPVDQGHATGVGQ